VADKQEFDEERAKTKGDTPAQRPTQKEDDSEWLRDQVGEDHNLTGSSTYRTLPDQPEKPNDRTRDEDELKDRQSNR
jgi:hypothetical protein